MGTDSRVIQAGTDVRIAGIILVLPVPYVQYPLTLLNFSNLESESSWLIHKSWRRTRRGGPLSAAVMPVDPLCPLKPLMNTDARNEVRKCSSSSLHKIDIPHGADSGSGWPKPRRNLGFRSAMKPFPSSKITLPSRNKTLRLPLQKRSVAVTT